MATKSISQLDTQATANETDLFEVAIVDANSASGYASKKESAAAIADAIVGEYQYPLRITGTTAKTIAGAINELNTLLSAKANTSSLATVATSGAYSDLSGKPTIDTALDSASTNAVENRAVASEINSIKSDMQDKADIITNSASGAIASFSDGADNLPVKDLIINIAAVQAGSGDPSPTNVRPISGWTGCNFGVAGNTIDISLTQSGSGDPSPTNIRPITSGLTLVRDDSSTLEVYGGTLDVSSRVLPTTLASVDLGDLSWTYDSTNGVFKVDLLDAKRPINNNTANLAYCEIYTPTNYNVAVYYTSADFRIGISSTGLLAVRNSSYTDALDFKAAMSGVKYVYELATAVTYQLTSSEVKRALFSLNAGTIYHITWQTTAGTVYIGTLNLTTGVLTAYGAYKKKKWSDFGNETQRANNFVSRNISVSDASTDASLQSANCICDIAPYALGDEGYTHCNIRVGNKYFYLYLPEDTSEDTDITFVYAIATPVTYQLMPIEIKTFLGQNNIWADTGDSSVSYRADTKKYIDAKFAELQALILNS